MDDLELAVRALIGTMQFHFLDPCAEMGREELSDKLVALLVHLAVSSSSAQEA